MSYYMALGLRMVKEESPHRPSLNSKDFAEAWCLATDVLADLDSISETSERNPR